MVKVAKQISKLPEKSNQTSNHKVVDETNKKGLSELQKKFQLKLKGARFRTINEKLYTITGDQAYKEFQSNPKEFDIYHEGFREQSNQWPNNPVDILIQWLKGKSSKLVVSDMGCGDGKISQSISNKVYSFDLVSKNSNVIACDIAHVPLPEESIDIVIFCLSLMGINITDFIKEAFRILKVNGIMKIVEVRSRFDDGNGTGIKKLKRFLKKAGFDIVNDSNDSSSSSKMDQSLYSNKMFFHIECLKTTRNSIIDEEFSIKPCVYKKR